MHAANKSFRKASLHIRNLCTEAIKLSSLKVFIDVQYKCNVVACSKRNDLEWILDFLPSVFWILTWLDKNKLLVAPETKTFCMVSFKDKIFSTPGTRLIIMQMPPQFCMKIHTKTNTTLQYGHYAK